VTGSRSTEYYPLFLDVAGRKVVIIGGGAVSARKAETMLRHGATVTIVAPEIASEISGAHLVRKSYEAADLENAFLVFAATNDPAINERVAADCRARNILVSVADAPARGDFIVPAIVESGPIRIAISTSGHSPALARRLKADLQPFAELAEILGDLRADAIRSLADAKPFFDSIIASDVIDLLRAGRREEADARVRQLCEDAGVRRE
jgi:precorrin-2 dehydrogenase/sirohydrochlorin ferrochelatase